ncbi:plexin-A4-like [Planococcus citri]|uniref:plexin-A4-like n=1 Tax=Planococcus citri TaxID=170843 RepID=UPI0031F834B1
MNFPMLLPILLTPLFIFYLNMNYSNAKSGKETWNVFSDESVEKFYHLAVDENGRWVYLTAANHIYQLSTDLQLQINYTISELSPSDCTAANCSHKLKRNTTRFGWADGDVLLLDYQNQRMISCWTFFLGICHAHDISNISKIWRTWFEPIVESELSNPIVAFIAPSLTKNSSTPLQTLYASCTPITTIGNVRKAQQKYFSSVITQNSTSYFTRNVCSPLPGDILVYGFSSENVGYFIAGNSAREHTANGYLIVIDTNKNNSCNKVSVLCSSGPDVNTAHKIAYAYIQKQNPDSGLKTDILYTLQQDYNFEIEIKTIAVCRHQMNKLHSQIQNNEPLIGELIFLRRPAEVWVTAMVVTSINNYTILFLGTSNSQLQKISIKGVDSPDMNTANRYAEITIDAGSRVHKNMLFDSTMNFLYVMTKNKLTKVKIHNCDEYNTSHECLLIRDPYCGWCFPRNRCCLKSECDGEQNGIDWVSFDIGKYIDASSINPEYTFSRTAKLKNVTFKFITPHPFINHTIMCLFEFSNFSINSTTKCNENSINCVIPILNHLPPTPMGNHSIGAQLSVQTNHLPAFQKFLIQLFDCTTYKSCFSCITSPYPCHWYAIEFRCTDNATWKEHYIVIGINFSSIIFSQTDGKSLYDGNKFSKNATFCPQFFFKNKSDIYIPAQTENTQQIQVYYRTPDSWYHIDRKYTCKFVFDSNDIKFAAIYDYKYKDSVQENGMIEGEFKCNDTFFYSESKPFITVEMSVSLNGSKPLENMYNTRIIVYKCEHMGDQCTACLNNTNYSCMWNSETAECKYYSLNDTSNITDLWLRDIRECSNSTTLRKNQSTNWLTENIHFIITLIVAVTFTVVAVFVIYCRASAVRSRKMQQQMNKMGMQIISMSQCVKRVVIENEIELDENESDILRLPNVNILYEPLPTLSENETESKNEYELPLDEKWEISRENLVLGKFLGQGEFGRVVKGNVSGLLQPDIVTTVAVKMLKNGHTDEDMVNLVKEMELMKLIGRHDNVLSLLGCCTQDGPLLIITEYSSHGNLLDFLRNHNRDLSTTVQEMTSIDLSETVLIMFAQQVANGMEYLASIKCIHRDLAARNVLVFDNHIVKIGDFGLARDIRHEYYYRQKTNGKFPVKWMAPESLKHCRYTIQSDVWSYGILVWEIMTFGTVPYLAYDDAEKLIQDIKAGYRMNKPDDCPEMLYCLMRKCWNYLPKDRPNFTTIVQELDAILARPTDNAGMEQCDPHYLNIITATESDHEESETDSLLSNSC